MLASLHIDELAFQEIRGVIDNVHLWLFSRQYSIGIDTIHDPFKGEIIGPWIRELKEEGEKTLLRATEAGLEVAKNLMASALLEKEDRCKRKLEDTEKDKLAGEKHVAWFTAICINLLAAEEALSGLSVRINRWRTQSGP